MKIEISGSRCITCKRYTQYYAQDMGSGEIQPINCGFCGEKQRTTRPGNRCRQYSEKGNISLCLKGSK